MTQNSRFERARCAARTTTRLWVENSVVPAGWQLASSHVLTGVPENDWPLRLEPGVCLDFVPVGDGISAFGPTVSTTRFAGKLGDAATRWLGRPAREWFAARGLDAGGLRRWIRRRTSRRAPFFRVCQPADLEPAFRGVAFCRRTGHPARILRGSGARLPRLSAAANRQQVNLRRLYEQRAAVAPGLPAADAEEFPLERLLPAGSRSHRPRLRRHARRAFPTCLSTRRTIRMQRLHDQMFRSAVLRHAAIRAGKNSRPALSRGCAT